MKQIFLLVLLVFFFEGFQCKGLTEEFTWNQIDYLWPGNSHSRTKLYHQPYHHYHYHPTKGSPASPSSDSFLFPGSNSNNAVPGTEIARSLGITYNIDWNVPMGANRFGNKLFISVPRRRVGVPSTLNYIWMNSTNRHNVPLMPYPDWSINQLEPTRDPNGLVSVYRTVVDPCDRLWLVDTGYIETPGNITRYHQSKIVIIDLHTDKIIKQYSLKDTDVMPNSLLATIVVDVTANTCESAFAYVPDLQGYGVVVYSLKDDDSWRVHHNYFYLESLHGDFYVGGQHFQWNDGVFSLALSDIKADGYRNMYFHSMAGIHLFSVSTRILRNRQLATRSYHGNDFKVVANRGPHAQTSSSDLHKPSGVLFLALVTRNSLGCWNSNKEGRIENFDVVYRDDKNFIYPADIKIHNDDVIVLSNTMPVQLYSRLNYNDINFRVWSAKVADAIKGTACAAVSPRPVHYGYYG